VGETPSLPDEGEGALRGEGRDIPGKAGVLPPGQLEQSITPKERAVPLSFLVNLWAVVGLAENGRRNAAMAAVITGLISPLSAMVWLTLYVYVVGYKGQVQ